MERSLVIPSKQILKACTIKHSGSRDFVFFFSREMPRHERERVDHYISKIIKSGIFDLPAIMNVAHKRHEGSKKERRYHYVAKINPTVKASVRPVTLPERVVATSLTASVDIVNMTV